MPNPPVNQSAKSGQSLVLLKKRAQKNLLRLASPRRTPLPMLREAKKTWILSVSAIPTGRLRPSPQDVLPSTY